MSIQSITVTPQVDQKGQAFFHACVVYADGTQSIERSFSKAADGMAWAMIQAERGPRYVRSLMQLSDDVREAREDRAERARDHLAGLLGGGLEPEAPQAG